jgi:hypothetical protein
MKTLFITSLVLFLFSTASVTLAQGDNLTNLVNLVTEIGNGDFDNGLDHIVDLAKEGNGTATFVYAQLLSETGDTEKFQHYLTLSANQGNPVAMKFLATSFFNGALGEQDFNQARVWFEQAAQYRNINSMVFLGVMHRDGLGMETNLKTSYFWFTVAGILKPNVEGQKEPEEFARELEADLSLNDIQKIMNDAIAWIDANPEIKPQDIPRLN